VSGRAGGKPAEGKRKGGEEREREKKRHCEG
jgi:hypothetical protein